VFRKVPCPPTKADISPEVLQASDPNLKKPSTAQCADCGKEFAKPASLRVHQLNNRCSKLLQKVPPSKPLPTINRSFFDNPDMSFVTHRDLEVCSKVVTKCKLYKDMVLVVLYRCLCERPDQPQNHDIVQLRNVKSRRHMHFWSMSPGSSPPAYKGKNCFCGLIDMMEKPMDVLMDHMGITDFPVDRDEAFDWLAAYIECKARLARGCTVEGPAVSWKVSRCPSLFGLQINSQRWDEFYLM
jgi:hypothetical protein